MIALLALLLACGAPEPAPSEPPPAVPAEKAAPEKAAKKMADLVAVSGARARAMPPAAPNSGAFMTFRNEGRTDVKLVAARAEVSKKVELHTHVMEDGMMKMRQVPEIAIPAGQQVVLEPGGLHVMFIGLEAPLEEGASFPLTLAFSDGSEKVVELPVQAIAPKH